MSVRRVVKVGGSLFDLPDLGPRLREWLSRQPGYSILIAGGGELADVIRGYDQRFLLGEEYSHTLCVRLLHTAALVLQEILGSAPLIESIGDSRLFRTAPAMILSPTRFLLEVDARISRPLPASWSVTTDSVAARVARYLHADELTLLKSRLPTDNPLAGRTHTLRAWSAAGYVDAYFPRVAGKIPRLRAVNLRETSFPEWSL